MMQSVPLKGSALARGGQTQRGDTYGGKLLDEYSLRFFHDRDRDNLGDVQQVGSTAGTEAFICRPDLPARAGRQERTSYRGVSRTEQNGRTEQPRAVSEAFPLAVRTVVRVLRRDARNEKVPLQAEDRAVDR